MAVGGKSFEDKVKVNSNLKSTFAQKFQIYREENDKILVEVNRFLNIISDVKSFGENEVEALDVFTKDSKLNDDNLYKEIFNALENDANEFLGFCEDLKKSVKDEEDSIREFLGQTTFEHVSTNKLLIDRISHYNKNKYDAVRKLFNYVPSLVDKLSGVVNAVELTVEHSAKFFVAFYSDFEKHLSESIDKGSLFYSLAKILSNLYQYSGEFNSQYSENEVAFMAEMGKLDKSINIFAERFFAGDYGYNRYNSLKNLLDDVGLDITKLGECKTYNVLDDEKKEKIDSFVEETLLHLLKSKKSKVEKVKKIYEKPKPKEESNSGVDMDGVDKDKFVNGIRTNVDVMIGFISLGNSIKSDSMYQLELKKLLTPVNYFLTINGLDNSENVGRFIYEILVYGGINITLDEVKAVVANLKSLEVKLKREFNSTYAEESLKDILLTTANIVNGFKLPR